MTGTTNNAFDPPVSRYVDDVGHEFGYVYIDHGRSDLAVHFSAFFGAWGNARVYRETFQGYFHRMKMLGTSTDRNWLFLCDTYGAEGNGTYYAGEAGDFFVERAMLEVLDRVIAEHRHQYSETVMVGSSMGATAALKFGLLRGIKGVVAISPHIDLDICAATQGRESHVAFILPDGNTQALHNYRYTRQIRNLVDGWQNGTPLPRLYLQTCEDDKGVYEEQALPLAASWRAHGGSAYVDARAVGGHTSDYATQALLLDVIGRLSDGREPDVAAYQTDPTYAGTITKAPLAHRLRLAASITPKRLLKRFR